MSYGVCKESGLRVEMGAHELGVVDSGQDCLIKRSGMG